MSIILDPTFPADGQNPRQGASDIRSLTALIMQILAQTGLAPVTFTSAPFNSINLATGAPTLQTGALVTADPIVPLGIASKQYVDSRVSTITGPQVLVGTGTFTTSASIPIYTIIMSGGGGGGKDGNVSNPGGGGGGGAVLILTVSGNGASYPYVVGAGGAHGSPGVVGQNSQFSGAAVAGGGGVSSFTTGATGGTGTAVGLYAVTGSNVIIANSIKGGDGGNSIGATGGIGGISFPIGFGTGGVGGNTGASGTNGSAGYIIVIPG